MSQRQSFSHRNNLYKTLFIAAMMIALLGLQLSAASAQEPLHFSNIEIDLWPEFDKPSMLVLYHIAIPASTPLPADLSIRIPAAAGTPFAVAVQQPDGQLYYVPYDQVSAGEWSEIKFKATTPTIQIEYYDPSLVKDGARRSYKYHWPGDYPVDNMKIQVQQPIGAENLVTKPSMNFSGNKDGLNMFASDVGALAVGQSFDMSIEYDKTTDELSSASLPVVPSYPIESTGLGFDWRSALPWAIALLGVVLIVGGAVWYWQSGREKTQPGQRSRHKPASEKQSAATEVDTVNIYCHQCGRRAGPGDRFCRACGTPLRSGG